MSQHDKQARERAAQAARDSYADWWSKAYLRQLREQRRREAEQRRQKRGELR